MKSHLFPGGESAMKSYLNSNVKYPDVAQENGVQGRVIVESIIEKDGSMSDVKVIRSVDPSLDRKPCVLLRLCRNGHQQN